MTGKVAYRLAVALHEAGILDRVPPCTHCGRPRMVDSRGSALPACGACRPRNANRTKGRGADPGESICPAGLHRVPAHNRRCDACADEADKVDQAADRWTLQQFHRHRLLPSVDARCEAGKATRGTVRQLQNQLRAAIELMAWSRPRGGLGRLSRSDVDEWLAGPSTRHWARQFLLWAVRQHLLDLPASAIPLRTPQAPSDVEDYRLRADPAHRLLHEKGTPADIRVAGLLVVLYGQHLSRIVGIERESVDPESMPPRIKLGRNWLELPDPMGRHIAELLAQAPRRSAPFAEDARWLFPGDGAGTHLSSDRGDGCPVRLVQEMAPGEVAGGDTHRGCS